MPKSAQRRWTQIELNVLEARRAQQVEPKLIARELNRTLCSVVMRCQIENRRRWRARQHRDDPARVQIEPQYVTPPTYVLRERSIRHSIPPASTTALLFSDPLDGYSAGDAKARTLSVQDALEICALSTGRTGELVALAQTYSVTTNMIESVLNGKFFEMLLPAGMRNTRATHVRKVR